MTELWLIRHGQSQSNAGIPTTGPGTSELTPLGHEQAKVLADQITVKPDLIIHSPFIRTRQTAAPLMGKFPDAPVEEWPVQEFNYLNRDKYKGSTQQSRRPLVLEYWQRCDPGYWDGEGAETFNQYVARVRQNFENYGKREGFIAVFSHGQFIRGTMWQMFNPCPQPTKKDMARYRAWRETFNYPNTGVVKFLLKDKTWMSPICAGHLDGKAELCTL